MAQGKEAVVKRVRETVRALLDRSLAPDDVRGFLLDRWARLLAGISLDQGEESDDWAAGWDTVHALLWSLEPKHGLDEARQLLHLIPLLLERLQDGCKALNIGKAEADNFFSQLAMLHAAIFRTGLHAQPAHKPIVTQLDQPQNLPWSAYAPTEDKAEASLPPATPAPLAQGPGAADLVAALQPGDRIAFVDGDTFTLQWVSAMRGMFLFTHPQEARSLTRAKLLELIESGAVRVGVH
jgi:hypothetical protein